MIEGLKRIVSVSPLRCRLEGGAKKKNSRKSNNKKKKETNKKIRILFKSFQKFLLFFLKK